MWERGSVCVRVMDRCVLFVLLVGGVVASAGAESFYKGDACVGSVIPPGNIEAGLLAPGTYGALWDALHADAAWEAYGFTQTVMEGPGIPEKAWQAPNHANHLRCQFTAKEARLTPREGTPTRSWNLTLRTVAIEGYPAWDTTVNVVAERNRLIYRRGSGIEEWYLNDPRGLEQGFTLVRPPCTGDVVVIEMVVEGSLRPRWSRAGEEVAFVDESDHVLLRYGNLSVMDATGRLLPGRMELTERGIRLVARLADARYPVTIDPLLMSEQWAYTGDQNGAYVGRALARADVNGDGRVDLIVGAPYYDNGETDEGRVLVFYGTASGFPSVPNLTLEINVAYANFGTAVSSAGDVNGDGYDDVIVGASRYNNLQVQEGAAYLFLGSASGLSASPAWQVESNQAYALLGDAVAGAGDVNGDGYDDVLVGIPSYDDGSTQDVGRVQCYYGSASGLSTTPGWTVTGDRANARLGFAVSTAGDMNGDTYDDVVIGAPYYTGTATQEGRIYVYYGSASGLSSSSDTVEMYTAYANLGYSVAAAGDVNGDGKSDIVVGAPSSATGPMPKGYVFYGPITSNVRVDIVGEQANSRFGKSVAGAGDINGDGYDDVIISAPDFLVQNPNNSSMVGVGKVYAYRGSQHGIQATVPEWTLQGSLDGLGLGAKVSGVGDVNGDGYADVLVGDPTFDARTVSTNRGRVRLFLGAQSLVAVPDVREQAQGFAQTNLINAGLTVGTVLHQCDNAVLAGSVISQDPAPGTLVPLNTPVNITVSTGPCPQNVLVPDVTGLANFSAFSQIGQAGLIVGTVTQQCDNGVPAGYVISQDPVAGTSVAGGTPVNLVVSTGTCTVEVPYVVGLPQGDAESTLAALGLTPQVSQQCHGMIPAGTVISQDPEYGNTVYYGSSVNLVVSTGPCTALVPDVTGQPLATAQATIAGAGFQVGLLTYQCHATIPVNHVISQNPAGGSVVASGSAISLLVSSGPCSVTVPNLAGQTQASAQAEIVAAGLTVGTITTQCSNTVLAGRIISQNPPAGSLVATGSPVNLVVSTGPCTVTVPNVVGQAQATAQATLTAAGLVTGTITQQCHNTVPAGTVISQSPAGGTIVTPGAVVMLVVSSGPCVSVPNVVGQAQAAAQATLSAAGLATGLTDRDLNGAAYRRLLRGTYVHADTPKGPHLWAGAALLLAPDGSFASHHTAARLLGAPVPDSSTVHLGTV
ncbi:MAG TPA: PASTA domain-containing protein, partial [Candidatus Hydrogenedentes bacterium]|nr:PASTA domain-containing protein [Candidatus Hydrogenedentota bacterium]